MTNEPFVMTNDHLNCGELWRNRLGKSFVMTNDPLGMTNETINLLDADKNAI